MMKFGWGGGGDVIKKWVDLVSLLIFQHAVEDKKSLIG
jgi:hypothetical protein